MPGLAPPRRALNHALPCHAAPGRSLALPRPASNRAENLNERRQPVHLEVLLGGGQRRQNIGSERDTKP